VGSLERFVLNHRDFEQKNHTQMINFVSNFKSHVHAITQSLTNDPITVAVIMSSALFFTGFLRNDYGELSRALVRFLHV
jgi:hypothetical protein